MRKDFGNLDELGAGTVLAVGLIGSLVTAGLLIANLQSQLIARARLAVVTDTAAIAGADVLRGLASGVPCDQARTILESASFTMQSCRLLGSDVLVEGASGSFTAHSRAGEPG